MWLVAPDAELANPASAPHATDIIVEYALGLRVTRLEGLQRPSWQALAREPQAGQRSFGFES